MKKIAVIDGNSLMHRAFHAVPDYMETTDGRHTNAVFGFLQMLLKMCEVLNPDGIVCAFDAGIPDFRMKAISRYKAQRPPTDPKLKEQFSIMENVLNALKIPVVKLKGWEGDDILGTLSKMGENQGVETYLVSGDRDVLQLASETTKIVHTKKGMSDVIVYGPEEVKERYGIGPELVTDFISLKGDTSDNIPGAPGIGEKTAARLLKQYGTVHEVIAHVDELSQRQRDAISSSVDEIEAGLLVATIVRDLDIDIDLQALEFPAYTAGDIHDIFSELRMAQHYKKFLLMAGGDEEHSLDLTLQEKIEAPEILTGRHAGKFLDSLIAKAPDEQDIAIVIEEIGQATLFGTNKSMAVYDGKSCAVISEDEGLIDSLYKLITSNCSIIALDIKKLFEGNDPAHGEDQLYPADSSIPALVSLEEIDFSRFFDLSIAAYLLESDRSHYELKELCDKYLGFDIPEKSDFSKEISGGNVLETLAIYAKAAFLLADELTKRLNTSQSMECYRDIDMVLIPSIMSIERFGMQLDCNCLKERGDTIATTLFELESKIYDLAGSEFNIGSPKQLGKVLFEDLGLPAKKKTKTGYSTDASVLAELVGKHEIAALIIEYRELSKLKSTYIDALPTQLRSDKRIHTTLNQTVAATGRLSSSDPNLQNIPVRSEAGRLIREAFLPYLEMGVPGKDAVFLSADYSQIELRVLAALSGDEGLISAFNEGEDFHRETASRVFNVPVKDVRPEMRSRAKAVNFGIVYGQQAFGLSKSLGISLKDAQDMIDRYFEAYPKVKAYLDDLISKAKSDGYVSTMFGRRRYVRDINSSNKNVRNAAERIAMNHPMQGSAADIIKLAMINVHKRLTADKFKSVMMLQVHDELDFSCPVCEIERLTAMVVDVMENIVELPVGLEVGVAYGVTWADAK